MFGRAAGGIAKGAQMLRSRENIRRVEKTQRQEAAKVVKIQRRLTEELVEPEQAELHGSLAAVLDAKLQSVVEDCRAIDAGGEECIESLAHTVHDHHLITATQGYALVESHNA